MKEVKSNIILKSESNSINIVSTILEEIREHYKIANEVFDDIYITVSEAINNAIYHGNKCDYSKKVYFNYNLKVNSSIFFEIEDEGEGFDYKKIPDPTLLENILSENGRGVFLIQQLANEFEYSKNGRKVKLKFYL